VSDPVSLAVPAASDLAIDIYLPGDTGATGIAADDASGSEPVKLRHVGRESRGRNASCRRDHDEPVFFLARVEVAAPENAGAIVAFGDSITDGTRSTPNTNNRWPDELARRLAAAKIPLGS